LKGIRVGTVTDIRLDIDFKTQKVRIPVIAEVDPERLIPPGADNELSLFIKAHQAEIDAGRHPGIEKMVEKGLRARLKTGSLLTGQLYVDVDFYPESAPKKLIYGGLHPEIPTLPSVVDELQKNITEVVASLKRLPLDKMGQELLGTLQGSNRLLNTPELRDTITAMNFAMNDIRQLTQTADKQIVNLAASVEKAMSSTIKVLEQVQPGAPMAVDMSNALEELAASARSIRVLTEYIERHPEALLQGKGVKGGK
ncbi:MAG: MCE family protein, partial [Methylococcus sp.]